MSAWNAGVWATNSWESGSWVEDEGSTATLPIFHAVASGVWAEKKIRYWNDSEWINMETYLTDSEGDAIILETDDYIVIEEGPTVKYWDGSQWVIFSA